MVKFEIGNIMRGRLSAHPLSLHNKVSIADSQSTLTSHRLKYESVCKNLALIFLYCTPALQCVAKSLIKYIMPENSRNMPVN